MGNRIKLKLISLIAVASAIGLFMAVAHGAGSASFSLSPVSGSHDNGTSFTVNVVENSGAETVNAVDARLSYDATKLQFVGVSTTSSPFSYCTQASGGSGSVTITCALLGSTVTSSQTIGTITFKALAGSGSTSVSFAGTSHIVRSPDSADIWNGSTTGATYTLTTPAPPATPPASTPPSSGSTSSGSSSSAKPSTTKTTTNSSTPTTTTAQQQANPAAPVAVSKTDPAGTSEQTYLVAIKAVDSGGKVLGAATVTLDGKTVKTDNTGVASFTAVKAGQHQVTIKSGNNSLKTTVTVAAGSPENLQQFVLKTKASNRMLMIEIIAGIIVVVLLFIGIGRSGLLQKIGGKHNKATTFDSTASSNFSNSQVATVIAPDSVNHGPLTPNHPIAPGSVITPQNPNSQPEHH